MTPIATVLHDFRGILNDCQREYIEREILKVLDESPWPRDVWPNTVEETGKAMREAMGDLKTTAASGVLMRHGWEQAKARFAHS